MRSGSWCRHTANGEKDSFGGFDEYLAGHRRIVAAEERTLDRCRQRAREKIALLAGELPRMFYLSPFRPDLVVLEEAPPSLQRKVRERGVILYESGKD